MAQRIVTYMLKDLPACLSRRVPEGSGPWSCLFYFAPKASTITAALFDEVPEPDVDHTEEGLALASLMGQAAVYGGLEEQLFGKGASLDIVKHGFHGAAPRKVRAWLKKSGHVEVPISRMLDALTLATLEGRQPKKLYRVKDRNNTEVVDRLIDDLWVLPRRTGTQRLVSDRGWATVPPKDVAKVSLAPYGGEGQALAGTLAVLDTAYRLGFVKRSGKVVRDLRRLIDKLQSKLDSAHGNAGATRAARKAAAPFAEHSGRWEKTIGDRSWAFMKAYRATGKGPTYDPPSYTGPDVAASWKSIHRKHGRTGWPRPVGAKSLEGFDAAFDNFTMPDDLRASLAIHDGERKGKARLLPPHRLLSLDEAMKVLIDVDRDLGLGFRKSVYDRRRNKSGQWFLPLTSIEKGVGYVLDMPDGEARSVLAVRRGKVVEVADSFGAWLASLAEPAPQKKTTKKKKKTAKTGKKKAANKKTGYPRAQAATPRRTPEQIPIGRRTWMSMAALCAIVAGCETTPTTTAEPSVKTPATKATASATPSASAAAPRILKPAKTPIPDDGAWAKSGEVVVRLLRATPRTPPYFTIVVGGCFDAADFSFTPPLGRADRGRDARAQQG